jgi:hypothetical protein
VNCLELTNGKCLKAWAVGFLDRADELGMPCDNIRVDVHAVADAAQSLETDIGAGEKALVMGLFKSLNRPGVPTPIDEISY